MTENNHSLLIAEITLGLLDHSEATELVQLLNREPDLRANFVHWTEHFASLYEQVEAVTHPLG